MKKEAKKAAAPIPNQLTTQAFKLFSDTIQRLDPELGKFVACSALSLSTQKFLDTFSLCCQAHTYIDRNKKKTVLSKEEKMKDDYISLTIIDSILGADTVMN